MKTLKFYLCVGTFVILGSSLVLAFIQELKKQRTQPGIPQWNEKQREAVKFLRDGSDAATAVFDTNATVTISNVPHNIRVTGTNTTIESDFKPLVTHTTNGWEITFKE